jgi:DNA polymerase III subunit delta
VRRSDVGLRLTLALTDLLKPAYLIHGDDHGAIGERRAGLRTLAEREGGAESVEGLEGADGTPAGAGRALAAMTLGLGWRVILVEGVERWKKAEVESELGPALANMGPDTTIAFFAREEDRVKAPAALHDAVKQAGGQVVEQATVKVWDLPKWVREQAATMGIELDLPAAKALVGQVGERQQRLLRELEKLALELDPPVEPGAPRRLDAEAIEGRAARSATQRAFVLADALLAGDSRAAVRSYVRLRAQGERLSGLTYLMASRLREGLAVAVRLREGESRAQVKRSLRMPPRVAERFVEEVSRADVSRLREAVGVLADLELNTRGGSQLAASRASVASLEEETVALLAIEACAARLTAAA